MLQKNKINLSRLWDKVTDKMEKQCYYINPILGKYKKWEFSRLLHKWAPQYVKLSLKTDSFEEAFGNDGVIGWLAKTSQKVIGLDISYRIVGEAKGKIHGGKLKWLAADISHMPFNDNTFDLIFSSSTFGYLENIEKGLKEAYRILNPGGILIISVNNRNNLIAGVIRRFFISGRKTPFPLSRAYTVNHFRFLLEKAGFKVLTHEPSVHIVPFLNSVTEFLERKGTPLFDLFSENIMESIKKYSIGRNPFKYLTGWYIVFSAQKSVINDNEGL